MNVSRLAASIKSADTGGFVAVASTPTLDRDGEVVAAGCFAPLPASVPVHLDHVMTTAGLIGRAVPTYVGEKLYVDAYFASTPDAQLARQKIADGVLDTVSVAFRAGRRELLSGVPTVTVAELLAVDVVTIPANRDARILSVRGYGGGRFEVAEAKAALARVRRQLVDHDLAEARRLLDELDYTAPARRGSRAVVEDVLRRLHYRES